MGWALTFLFRAANLCRYCGRNTEASLQLGAGVGQVVMILQSSRGVLAQAHPSTAQTAGPPQISLFTKPLLLQWGDKRLAVSKLSRITPMPILL